MYMLVQLLIYDTSILVDTLQVNNAMYTFIQFCVESASLPYRDNQNSIYLFTTDTKIYSAYLVCI